MNSSRTYLTFDIGATNTRMILWDGDTVVTQEKYATPVSDQQGIHTLLTKAKAILEGRLPSGIGIGVCGQVKDGSIDGVPPNLPYWENTPIQSVVAETFGGSEILVAQDGICSAWAEGELQPAGKTYLLSIGTGVGGAFIDTSVSPWYTIAAEPGHMIVDMRTDEHIGLTAGSLTEYLAGGKAEHMYGRSFDLFTEKSPEWELFAYAAACGISTIASLFNPDRVILSGGVIERQNHLLAKIISSFQDTLQIFDADRIRISLSNIPSDIIVGQGLATMLRQLQ